MRKSRLRLRRARLRFKHVRGIRLALLALALGGVAGIYQLAFFQSRAEEETIKKEIGQMLLVGFRGTAVDKNSGIVKAIQEYNLGGVVLTDYDVSSKAFGRNIVSPKQLRQLTADLQRRVPTPLFIAIDAEGGQINRLKPKYGFKDFPSHQALGRMNDPRKTHEVATEIAKELRELGINWNYAPVVDVNLNPKNPIIGERERSFSADPAIVTNQARAFIRAHREQQVISVLKHFPGHGSSRGDTHRGLQDITDTWRRDELIPYKELIKERLVDAIMTAHVTNRTIDKNYPATLSPAFLTKMLREDLGFKGVIITDDLGMGAIAQNYGFEEALIRAVNAGADILLLANNSPQPYDEDLPARAARILMAAAQSGRIQPERIHSSYRSILELKKRYEIMP